MLLNALGGLLCIVGIVCWVLLMIDAFRDEIWKGVLSLFCGLYLFYYVVFESDHDQKWLLLAGCVVGLYGGPALVHAAAATLGVVR